MFSTTNLRVFFCVQLGLDIEDLENNESDAGLGNGGKICFFLTLSC